MPDFAFKLKTINTKTQKRVKLMETVLKKHPKTKDFNKLVKYLKQEQKIKISQEEKLLKILFGKN